MMAKSTKPKPQITAHQLLKLLAIRHSKDVFVQECKTGPSVGGEYLQMDAWAMKKSWANPRVIAYEIKINRQDFLRDDKWQGYLSYCNEFYFVCPPEIIDKSELPDNVGLIVSSVNGTVLFTKRKSALRDDVNIPEDMWRYILMWRARIGRDNYCETAREYWTLWLKKREIDRAFGHHVSHSIRQTIKKQIEAVTRKNERLQFENDQLASVRETIEKLGYDNIPHDFQIEQRLESMRKAVPPALLRAVSEAGDAIATLKKGLEAISQKETN